MQYSVGTSGYSYPKWRGRFYPPKMPPAEMLNYYAQRFPTVELNNTFYRLPDQKTVASWTEQVPSTFQFAVKAPQTITHFKRLKDVGEVASHFFSVIAVLKARLGPLLFQLPPNFKKDLPRLKAFLELLGDRTAAFEFRHQSWLDDEVFECLRAHGCALCIADMEGEPPPKLVATADWGYVRLRRDSYTEGELRQWLEQLSRQKWRKTYVYFMHDEVGVGAEMATQFVKLIGAQ